MPVGVNGAMTQSTAGRWLGRWMIGAALGQLVFGGTMRLVLAVLFGAALGGLGVWLIQRNRPPGRTRRRPAFPRPRRWTARRAPAGTPTATARTSTARTPTAGHGTARATTGRAAAGATRRSAPVTGTGMRRRFSPRARPPGHETGRPCRAGPVGDQSSPVTARSASGAPRRATG